MPIIPKNRKKSIKISTAFSGVGYTLTANAGENVEKKWGASNLTTACAPLTGGGILFGGIPPGGGGSKGGSPHRHSSLLLPYVIELLLQFEYFFLNVFNHFNKYFISVSGGVIQAPIFSIFAR